MMTRLAELASELKNTEEQIFAIREQMEQLMLDNAQ